MTGTDVAQPDQARIVGINAQHFLKNSGNFVISIKASCIDSTAPPEAVFAREVPLPAVPPPFITLDYLHTLQSADQVHGSIPTLWLSPSLPCLGVRCSVTLRLLHAHA